MTHALKFKKEQLVGASHDVDVFQGLHVDFGRPVAIKELRGGIKTSESLRDNFYREYETWAKFQHKRLVDVIDIDRNHAWVVQDFLRESIADQEEKLRQNPRLAFDYLQEIVEGLQFLHGKGYLHCNIKASNIRIGDDGAVLCDGRCIDVGKTKQLPKPRGSNKYLAPEMINEDFGPVSYATDLYVVATVMLEVLAGDQFENLYKGYISGTPDQEMGWVRWHNSREVLEPISTLLPKIPQGLAKLLDNMLCKDVRQRIGNTGDALTEIAAARKVEDKVPAAPAATSAASGAAMAIAAAEKAGTPVGASAAPSPPASGHAPAAPAAPAAPSAAPAAPDAPPTPPPAPHAKLIDRPEKPVYVRIASGPLSGTLVPLDIGDIRIGESQGCHVKLSAADYPTVQGREILISLGPSGWQIADQKNNSLLLGTKKHFESTAIRSGQMIRMTNQGPDFQFVVQGENDWTWLDIAAELGISKTADAEKSDASAKKMHLRSDQKELAAVAAAPAGAPRASTAQPPARQASAAPGPPPKAPQTKQEKKKEKQDRKTAKAAAAAPAAAVASAAPVASSTNANAPAPALAKVSNDKQSFFEKLKTDKNKRNNFILIAALPIVLIIVFIVAQPPKKEKQDDEQKTEQNESEKNGDEAKSESNAATENGDESKPADGSDNSSGDGGDDKTNGEPGNAAAASESDEAGTMPRPEFA